MQPDQLVLRGYVVPDGDSYFAICLDVNLYARGSTADEAIQRCLEFVSEYINEAVNEDRKHIGDLIPRRAPLYFWAQYRWLQIASALRHFFHRDDNDKSSKGGNWFKAPLPIHVGC